LFSGKLVNLSNFFIILCVFISSKFCIPTKMTWHMQKMDVSANFDLGRYPHSASIYNENNYHIQVNFQLNISSRTNNWSKEIKLFWQIWQQLSISHQIFNCLHLGRLSHVKKSIPCRNSYKRNWYCAVRLKLSNHRKFNWNIHLADLSNDKYGIRQLSAYYIIRSTLFS
jgi:hypothetical protein